MIFTKYENVNFQDVFISANLIEDKTSHMKTTRKDKTEQHNFTNEIYHKKDKTEY